MKKVSKDPNIEDLNKLIEESKKISGVIIEDIKEPKDFEWEKEYTMRIGIPDTTSNGTITTSRTFRVSPGEKTLRGYLGLDDDK